MKYAKITLVVFTVLILLFASPVCAKSISVKTTSYNLNTGKSVVTPYITVGYGHSGSYKISGLIYYRYHGKQKWQYHTSGTIYPVFSKYYGWRFKAPYIYTWKFKGVVNIN
ncbi:hypothetical protein [Methanobacterium alcaliphilum]|uniref:hypothetical protein n=1 Tax=Methanobacterium alcaliphilum TaxID=392018 RepID=UPI00200B0110|nr:hypothetical protein [Methanobacterium alcaliphilum]MCK9152573.1 hypothetical protein [Methanobacterium alcaliphilum]